MQHELSIAPADPQAVAIARKAFAGLQRGAATGVWSDFVDLLHDDVRIMIPVPSTEPNAPEGLLLGKALAQQIFSTRHVKKVEGVKLECMRVAANGPLVMMECRVEGNLNGEQAANHFIFNFEVANGLIVSMYEYASWTAKGPHSRWGQLDFSREAFGQPLIPLDDSVWQS